MGGGGGLTQSALQTQLATKNRSATHDVITCSYKLVKTELPQMSTLAFIERKIAGRMKNRAGILAWRLQHTSITNESLR